ncbi:hypothetical protein SEA_YELLOWPANDA_51 [Microbacterium phage YellowPanda]|uniref:Uncharacterized protein n=1 Tax=Microbacterium phage TinyTimothy TaxID=2583039 RepID=A0A4Y6EI40_9CAUD|nr:hypothetical protein HWC33_gp48 [Microbacterium phage TinyTimothy]QDF17001.1 hypothetical protein SEA_TINYTIMOTHY_48 [Microbacterium phage TinyTimothy]
MTAAEDAKAKKAVEDAEKKAAKIVEDAEKKAAKIVEDAEAKAAELEETGDETDGEEVEEDANDLLNRAWSKLASELDDGVAKSQVLGALTSVQLRAREVVLEHTARRSAE